MDSKHTGNVFDGKVYFLDQHMHQLFTEQYECTSVNCMFNTSTVCRCRNVHLVSLEDNAEAGEWCYYKCFSFISRN